MRLEEKNHGEAKTEKWVLGSGELVTDRYNSHLRPDVRRLIPEVLARVHSGGRAFIEQQVNFEHPIGETICVATNEDDEIVMAHRPHRKGPTRFVRGRSPEPTRSATVVLKKKNQNEGYVLITAFLGPKAEPEPWDRRATTESRKFWANHALVWGSCPVTKAA